MLNESATIRAEWEEYKTTIGNDTSGVLDWCVSFVEEYDCVDMLSLSDYPSSSSKRFFRRSAFYDTEAYVLDIGILYDAPPSGEENLAPYQEEITCVTTSMEDIADSIESDSSASPDSSGASISIGGFLLLGWSIIHAVMTTPMM